MYSEKTEIVDVVAITENNSTTYSLSKKAGDLFEAAKAGTVIRRHDVNESGNPDYKDYAYVGLSEVKLNGSGYSFKFASGDEFTASDADAYPSASSISDAIAGGSSDEPLIGEHTFSPALINLYDPDSEDTETYYPDGAYDSDNGVFVLDVSAAYERLKRGQNVWIRWYSDVHDGDVPVVEQVLSYAVDNDTLYCSTWFTDVGFRFTNYTGESESDGE